MAIVCGLFNDNNGKNEYADTEMAVLYSLLKHDKGVVVGEGDELKVTLGTGLEVKVGTGAAWIGEPCGWFMKNDAEVSLPIDTEVEGYKRSDRVILKLDRNISALDITMQVKKGSPVASEPVAPELEQNSMVFELPLAKVVVIGGTNTIDLIDERYDACTAEMVEFVALPAASGTIALKIHLPDSVDGGKLYRSTSPYAGEGVGNWGILVADITDDINYYGTNNFYIDNGLGDNIKYYYKMFTYLGEQFNEAVGVNETTSYSRVGLAYYSFDNLSGSTVIDDYQSNDMTGYSTTYFPYKVANGLALSGTGAYLRRNDFLPTTGYTISVYLTFDGTDQYILSHARRFEGTNGSTAIRYYGYEIYIKYTGDIVIATGAGSSDTVNRVTLNSNLVSGSSYLLTIYVNMGISSIKVRVNDSTTLITGTIPAVFLNPDKGPITYSGIGYKALNTAANSYYGQGGNFDEYRIFTGELNLVDTQRILEVINET